MADFFDGLDEDQLQTRSLCDAWTVREVLGHLVMPMAGSLGGFLLQVVRARGSINRASEAVASQLSRRPVGELTALLRDKADLHGKAPGVGPMGQMADGCVHLRDCARPLGLPDDVSIDDWRMVLDWLPSGVPGLVPKRRARGVAAGGDRPGVVLGSWRRAHWTERGLGDGRLRTRGGAQRSRTVRASASSASDWLIAGSTTPRG